MTIDLPVRERIRAAFIVGVFVGWCVVGALVAYGVVRLSP